MAISRRTFLIGGASALALAACSGGDDDDAASTTTSTTVPVTVPVGRPAATPLTAEPFTLGVASGDPAADSVVLWTRLLGAEGEYDVVWSVLDGERVVAAGVEVATPDDAHTIHALATGLEPGHAYDYVFTTGDFTSATGRTRTTGGDALRFAFASCQDWQDGYYTAHAGLAKEDVDLVVWLGDYIYEGGISDSAVRPHNSAAVKTLDAYRARYALYKSDPNLQATHASAPWFAIWDDHEVQNNYAGTTVDPARRAAAYQAWWEHMPTRLAHPRDGAIEIYRTLEWGGIATIFGLDGRQHRDEQPCGTDDLGAGCPEREEPDRQMLGAEQETWLFDGLRSSTTTWNVLANQTILSPSGIPIGDNEIFNLDQWDGYPAARDRLLAVVAETDNVVVVTGDIHASAVGDLRHEEAVVATELVGPAISSTFPAQYAAIFEAAGEAAGAAMVDASHNGYVVCEVTPDTLTATYRVVETTHTPTSTVSDHSAWKITAGTPGVSPLA